jgi:hypothetical protein
VLNARRLLSPVALITALGALALTAPAANAGALVASAGSCPDQVLSQPFLPWSDPSLYTPLSDGGFEAKADGWDLRALAGTVRGNEPWSVAGNGRYALSLPSGGAATSPVLCAGVGHPTLRFFAQRTGGSALAPLRVDVLFEDATGAVNSLTIGRLVGDGGWSPSPAFVVGANLLTLLPGDLTPLEFRFTPEGGSSWTIDDVFVDPWRGS